MPAQAAGGGGERWRAHLSDAESGEELAVLTFDRPLDAEFQPFSQAPLGLGPLGGEVLVQPRSGQLVPDERTPWVIAAALALLGAAVLAGRWRTGWGEGGVNNSQSLFRRPG